jgi:hypothetical protein
MGEPVRLNVLWLCAYTQKYVHHSKANQKAHTNRLTLETIL